jgi:AAA domain
VRIVVSETALESLLAYSGQGPEHSRLVTSTLDALVEEGHDRQVLKLSGSPRPIWTHPLDENKVIYFTYGHGADTLELRIAFVGPSPSDPESDLRHVLVTAGDVPYHEIPDKIWMNDRRTATSPPELPDMVLGKDTSLDNYLTPSDDILFEALDHEDKAADDLHGRRYRVLAGLRSAQELPIRLSPQQERLLGIPLPLLFQGVAGSGKTTIVAQFAHRQLLEAPVAPSVLIVTYTEELRQFTETILAGLDELEPAQSPSIQVRTWRGLCDDLAARARMAPFAWAADDFFLKQLHLQVGSSVMAAKTKHLKYEIHEFIRSTLKGRAMDPSNPPPPSRGAFLKMESMPLDGQIDRGTLYDLAQHYQHALAVRGLSDDTDAARRLLAHIDEFPKYDYVMVDEVQDYTFVQLVLLSRLCRRMEGLLFAGDADQVLHSVSFTWQQARQAIWKAWKCPPPEPVTIDYNYRNPQPVSNLANTVLKRRAIELGMPIPVPTLSNQPLTPRPIRLILPQARIETLLAELASKIGSLGIIRKNSESNDIFINDIKLERLFTPESVKGLEFNVVCLVNFNEDYKDLVAGTKDGSLCKRQLLFNEVYVSVTRTRAQLLLLDRRQLRAGLWESHDLHPLIDDAESTDSLSRLVAARFENRTRQDWEFDAMQFEEARAYKAAGECWERSGRPEKAALSYERGGRLDKALDIYRSIQRFEEGARIALRLGKNKDAAEFLELGGQLTKAAELWAGLGRNSRAAQLARRAAEEGLPDGDWSMVGKYYAADTKYNEAAACYERASNWAKAADNWLAARQPARAAERYEQASDWAKAAESWLAAGQPAQAAARYEQARDWAKAADNWLTAGEPLQAAAAMERQGRIEEAAATRAEFHEQQGRSQEAAEQWLAAGRPARAAERYEQASDWAQAADSWLAAGDPARAAERYEQASDWAKAADSWLAAGDPARAAAQLKRAGDIQRLTMTARSLERDRQFRAAGAVYAVAGKRMKAGWMTLRGRFSQRQSE